MATSALWKGADRRLRDPETPSLRVCPLPPDPKTHTPKIDLTDTGAPCDVRRYEMGNVFLNTEHFDTMNASSVLS